VGVTVGAGVGVGVAVGIGVGVGVGVITGVGVGVTDGRGVAVGVGVGVPPTGGVTVGAGVGVGVGDPPPAESFPSFPLDGNCWVPSVGCGPKPPPAQFENNANNGKKLTMSIAFLKRFIPPGPSVKFKLIAQRVVDRILLFVGESLGSYRSNQTPYRLESHKRIQTVGFPLTAAM